MKMGSCDLCGKKGRLYDVKIEETIMQVCDNCKQHGKVIGPTRTKAEIAERNAKIINNPRIMLDRLSPNSINKKKKIVISKLLREDFAKLIKEAREQRGMKQEDLAKKLKMKESLIHNFETNRKKPGFKEAEIIGKFLGISLVENYDEEKEKSFETIKTDSGPLTLGDMIKIKKK